MGVLSGSILLASIPHGRLTIRPITTRAAVVDKEYKMRVPYQLKEGQSRNFHKLPSGLKMEVVFQEGLKSKGPDERGKKSQNPPLVFVHGSFHAAWCWTEHWLPFFSHHGYDCYALSLLGQGESDAPHGLVAGTLQTHAGDIADFIQNEMKSPPVLVGHSFEDLLFSITLLMSEMKNHRKVKTCIQVLLGLFLFVLYLLLWVSNARYLFSKPIAAFKVTWSLAAKAFQTSLPLCRETFFSMSMDDQLVQCYQKLMTESSRMPLFDLRKLNASLPVASVANSSLKVLVLGAKDDFIVDMEGLRETGRFYGVSPICLEGAAHDMMLDTAWKNGAELILSWLSGLHKEKDMSQERNI